MQVPEGWKKSFIGNTGSIITGSTPKTSDTENYGDEFLFVSPADMGKEKIIFHTEKKISLKGYQSGRALSKDSVMVTCIGSTIGKIGLASSACITNQQINSITCSVDNNPHFIYYSCAYLKSYLVSLAGTTAVPIVNKTEFSQIPILLPPLPEQEKIAEILSTCDEGIESTDKQIAKLKDLKKAMMQELLTKGIDHKEFKESPLGKIPKSWRVVRIAEYITQMKSGLSRKIVPQDIGLPVMISGNIQDWKLDTSGLKFWYKEDPQGANTDNYILNDGDILLCFINSLSQIGKACIFTDIGRPCIYTTNLFRIISNSNICNNFLFQLIASGFVQSEIDLITKPAVNQASFTKEDFFNIAVILPPLAEQKKIADILSSIDDNIESKERKLSRLKDQKKALMNDLLTGKVRMET